MAIRGSATKVSAVISGCSLGLFLALVTTAPIATADPADPVPPGPAITSQSAGTDLPAPPPEGVPHLASPDALPPGSTMDPGAKGNESPNVSYLKDLYQAVQSHEISGKEALLMGLAQRGMNTPYPAQTPGPNHPTSPGDPDPTAATPPAPASPDPLVP